MEVAPPKKWWYRLNCKTFGPDLSFKELKKRIVTGAPEVPWEISDIGFSIVAVDLISTHVPEDST
jgi:hypothetical protein